jgi:4-carboxymuconolactone decarboxylase
MEEPERRLRLLAESGSARAASATVSALDAKTDALVKIAALVAINAVPASYLCAIRTARTDGASVDEVIDTLVAVSTTVGMARVVAATPGVAEALGIDIDAALEMREQGIQT